MDFTAPGRDNEDADFTNDNTGQLTGADRNNQGVADETYSYDDNGNRLSANGTTYGTPGTNNRLTDDGTYTYAYDDEGNRTTRTRKSSATADDYRTEYTWDHRNASSGSCTRSTAASASRTTTPSCPAPTSLVNSSSRVESNGRRGRQNPHPVRTDILTPLGERNRHPKQKQPLIG